jgi:hypothetical protein
VVSVPPKAQSAVPAQPLAGKPVLVASNYIPQRDGPIPGMYDGPPSSEVLQQHLPYRARGQGVQQHHLLAPPLAGVPGRRFEPGVLSVGAEILVA